MVQQIISPETFSLSFKTFFSFAWHKKFRFSSLGNLRFLIFINKITFFFNSRETFIERTPEITFTWEEGMVFTEQVMKWGHFQGGARQFATGCICFCLAKQPLSILSKQSFSEIPVYFKLQFHLLEFPSILLLLRHLNLYHLKYFICMISGTWIFISFQEQEKLN